MTFEERIRPIESTIDAYDGVAFMPSYEDCWNAATAAQREPMSCTHPAACAVSDDEGTSYCGWCAEVGEARRVLEAVAEQLAEWILVEGTAAG